MHCIDKVTRSGITLAALVVSGMCFSNASASTSTYNGEIATLGGGTVGTYLVVADGRVPVAMGIRMTEKALEGLPPEPNNNTRCFDANGDGRLEAGVECLGEYETVLKWPLQVRDVDVAFKWVELDWNPHGHNPPHVYDKPHFDMHFYMAEENAVHAIRSGTCGEMVDCEDFARARVPVPVEFMPPGYIEVGAVVPAMGNHLVNSASPELASPPMPFTHTLIYGAYDGHITFLEPMITREFLLGRPNLCVPIVQPGAWETPGYYPTRYCMRYLPDEASLTVSLEGFSRHGAAADLGRDGERVAAADHH